MTRRKIYIAHTGGTIGMRRTERGFEPAADSLRAKLDRWIERAGDDLPEVTFHESDPLLDSSNMTPADWHALAEDLAANAATHDGFLVLHGTDTMTYTASALSFMLENLNKPVLLTGSQIPIGEMRSDGRDNIVTALSLLNRHADRIAEVCICFGEGLMRGNRTTKTDATGLAAFESPNHPPLGSIGIRFDLDWSRIRAPRADAPPLNVRPMGGSSVGAVRLYPGMRAEALDGFLGGVDGLVLEGYGSGNGPGRNTEMMEVLRAATDAGKVIVVVTQPLRGSADLKRYGTGRALADAGVTGGFDMTAEAALTKLTYLLACESDPAVVRRLCQEDLRGELTLPTADSE